jgi:hypothetical protein
MNVTRSISPLTMLLLSAIALLSQGTVGFQIRPKLCRPGCQVVLPNSVSKADPVVATTLFSSSNSEEEDTTNYDEEEILLQIHLSALEGVSMEEAKDRVSGYTQSFPFAAVLPVQPLQYVPTPDGGVDVRFMRKKTTEKGSLDGGMRFFLTEDRDGLDLVVKRNSFGQTIPKMFAEKLVVQGFVKGISGEENDKTSPPPTDVVMVESVFHKWLQV